MHCAHAHAAILRAARRLRCLLAAQCNFGSDACGPNLRMCTSRSCAPPTRATERFDYFAHAVSRSCN